MSSLLSFKKDLRKAMHLRRDQLSLIERTQLAQRAASHLLASDVFRKSQHIACYMAKGAEISAQPMIEAIWRLNKTCYLPVLDPDTAGRLCFMPYDPNDDLVRDRFGIYEPSFDRVRAINVYELDLVITPLTAFDARGHRIGMGGGYYDRTFAFKTTCTAQKPVLCGLAYAFQELPEIHTESWDICLDAVVTEYGLLYF
ncbi:MAG: 5-formyltetrahydrofolate cyclo-ligase [Gammaproteobacteria bacterium]|nr:5-formyltetrahydrofolate cyclo-ligase [Gammaproteobacteria bacterium]MBU1926976.1 5-formyltetrahydrofolate cyclo-ligase [Gammaproteobacteria bacterium]MBU2545585.1 5-formyltetrahydrofolate cyclo-ligase [Gammaproteobacteria bacterium]